MDQQQVQHDEFPGFTEWSQGRFLCFPSKYVASIEKHFCGEWEVDPGMPLFVVVTLVSSFAVYIWAMPNVYGHVFWYYLLPVSSVLFLGFLLSYINIIATGPGYYPFYYPQRDTIPNPTEVYLISSNSCPTSGIISNDHQYEWCHNKQMPPRSILSKSARRIVMKPDHFCGWTATWIGKKNFKLFVLFNCYGALYTLFYCGTAWKSVIGMFADRPQLSVSSMFVLIILLFAVNFFFFTASFAFSALKSLCDNLTSWEEWNNVDPKTFDKGCCNNCADSCGSLNSKWKWILPIAPFGGIPNDELMKDYPLYQRNNTEA